MMSGPSAENAAAKARVLSLTPTELDQSCAQQLDAVAALYHGVLPNISQRYLRKYMRRSGVRTLVLTLPHPPAGADEDDDEEAGGADEDSSDDGDDDSSPPDAEQRPREAAVATEAHRTAVAQLRRRLVGAISYETGHRLGQRLLQVGLLGVRIRFQTFGVGSRLLRPLLQPRTVDPLDAAVVFADRRAVPFFKRHGFSDDPMLNARYREVLEPWERSELMSQQLPPAVPDGAAAAHSSWASREPLEQQLAAWRHARLLEYSKELALVERLQAEVLFLRDKVARQESHAAYLAAENQRLRRDKAATQHEFESYRQRRAERDARSAESDAALDQLRWPAPEARPDGARAAGLPPADLAAGWAEPSEGGGAALAADAAAGAGRLGAGAPSGRPGGEAEPGAHRASAAAAAEAELPALQEEVDSSVKPAHGVAALRLTRARAVPPARAGALGRRFESCRARLHDGALALRLFYAAPREELQRVLEDGFDAAPLEPNGLHAFGRGWYFTRYASRAHHFNGGAGCLLFALVAVGNTETVVKRDVSRGAPSAGFDSLIVPGRQLPSTVGQPTGRAGVGSFGEDYVIFDGSQALPLYLLEYDATLL